MDGLKTKEDRRFQTFWVIFFILISVIANYPGTSCNFHFILW